MAAVPPIQTRLSKSLPRDVRKAIASAIWGGAPGRLTSDIKKRSWEDSRTDKLTAYFAQYEYETTTNLIGEIDQASLQTHQDLEFFIELLKKNPGVQREDLTDYCNKLVGNGNLNPQAQPAGPALGSGASTHSASGSASSHSAPKAAASPMPVN